MHSVFTHRPPQQPTSSSEGTCLYFWFHGDGHDERVLTPKTQLATHTLALPCPPQLHPHTVLF